jgi:hypothetical protein
MSATIQFAVGRLIRSIRQHLPIAGQEPEKARSFLVVVRDLTGASGEGTFGDLLVPLPPPAESPHSVWDGTACSLEWIVRRRPGLAEVEVTMGQVQHELEAASGCCDLLRGVFAELCSLPLYAWRSAGHISDQLSPDGKILYLVSHPDGVPVIARWVHVKARFCPVDPHLLATLESAKGIRMSDPSPPTQGEVEIARLAARLTERDKGILRVMLSAGLDDGSRTLSQDCLAARVEKGLTRRSLTRNWSKLRALELTKAAGLGCRAGTRLSELGSAVARTLPPQ